MIEVEEKQKIHKEYKEFSDFFIDDLINKSLIQKSPSINQNYSESYTNKTIRADYISIISRLDEIESLINTKVAHKSDIVLSKNEIIQEQKRQLDESKDYIRKMLVVLNKKSTPNIFATITLVGLLTSSVFLAFTIIFGDIVLSKLHFIISTIGFFLMFIMARISSKILYERDL